ncbi:MULTISPECIES: hypothetical protein [unclassified Coleofasciculus]|uniref:hypothetical protein n=1 Tax=unclassified Coleofasciculus TaxID=2692782 RepID=UPI00187F0495|nr:MULTISPECIES: hypothetical protein [unclassified Coleofasciculus]MBE9128913.1 hypothetical protein [Coleofasciculus sp. LEGE 07081]MBE9151651.1 hypothetical protein [Coleofasciculus sp. LEGE 07092]
MIICIETAQKNFGDRFRDEAIIRDLALSLYVEAVRKFGESQLPDDFCCNKPNGEQGSWGAKGEE